MVRKYLLAHLKKCSADFVTEEGKYARFAEKCFHKTLGTRLVKMVPRLIITNLFLFTW